MGSSQNNTQQLVQFSGVISNAALSVFQSIIASHSVQIKLVKKRKSKYGDFRYHRSQKTAQITVNSGMSADATVFILAHEIAHFLVHSLYKREQAHGVQWKNTFGELLIQLMDQDIFSESVSRELCLYIEKPTATLRRNSCLHKELFGNDMIESGTIALNDISKGSKFTIGQSPRIYEKLDKRRTRYVCCCLQNKRLYLVSQHLMVNTLE